MPFADNLAVAKDIVIVVRTITTMSLGLYGLKVWKRDLVGKETYAVIRDVIKQLHKVSKAAGRTRRKVHLYEHVKMARRRQSNLQPTNNGCLLRPPYTVLDWMIWERLWQSSTIRCWKHGSSSDRRSMQRRWCFTPPSARQLGG